MTSNHCEDSVETKTLHPFFFEAGKGLTIAYTQAYEILHI